MIRDNNEVKDKINILLNTDNYYGSYKNNLTRILIYIVSLAIPFMIYTLLLALIIPFRFFIVPFILYALRMALIIIGREAERKEDYIKQMNDDYATAKELIRIVDIHDDGVRGPVRQRQLVKLLPQLGGCNVQVRSICIGDLELADPLRGGGAHLFHAGYRHNG